MSILAWGIRHTDIKHDTEEALVGRDAAGSGGRTLSMRGSVAYTRWYCASSCHVRTAPAEARRKKKPEFLGLVHKLYHIAPQG